MNTKSARLAVGRSAKGAPVQAKQNQAAEMQTNSIHIRKIRSDRGKARNGYKKRNGISPETRKLTAVSIPAEKVARRAYNFKTRIPAGMKDDAQKPVEKQNEVIPNLPKHLKVKESRLGQIATLDHLIKLVLRQLQDLNQLKFQLTV